MRKSREVPLTLLAAAALASIAAAPTIGCRDNGPPHCVDAQNRLAPDAMCQTHSGGGVGYVGYRYIYGGSSGGHYGDTVVGASVSRGGFGHFGGGGGGGGE
jgi:hypothetical protein